MPKSERVDAGDARYVQAIHTSIVLGSGVKAGHADFYVDGGVAQPGCATKFLRKGLLGAFSVTFMHKGRIRFGPKTSIAFVMTFAIMAKVITNVIDVLGFRLWLCGEANWSFPPQQLSGISLTFYIYIAEIPTICNHFRAVELFQKSLNPKNAQRIVGVSQLRNCALDSNAGLSNEYCESTAEIMGIHNYRRRGRFDLTTAQRTVENIFLPNRFY